MAVGFYCSHFLEYDLRRCQKSPALYQGPNVTNRREARWPMRVNKSSRLEQEGQGFSRGPASPCSLSQLFRTEELKTALRRPRERGGGCGVFAPLTVAGAGHVPRAVLTQPRPSPPPPFPVAWRPLPRRGLCRHGRTVSVRRSGAVDGAVTGSKAAFL